MRLRDRENNQTANLKGIQMANITKQSGASHRRYKTVRIAYDDWYALRQLSVNTDIPMVEWLSVAVPLLYSQFPEYYKHLPKGYDVLPSDRIKKP
jgi:hypothetical protein